MVLVARGRRLPLVRTLVMGVLNVTPDSFSDGGLWFDTDAAVAHALEMIEQGADILDIGGESTRPGAEPVPEDEELRRVIPVIEAVVQTAETPISIDTRKASVAHAAVETGASILNDTGGEEADPAMPGVAAETGAGVVFMHSRGTPATMRQLTDYKDVVTDVRDFLDDAAEKLQAAGVARESIVLDPGFGFAKNAEQNLELLDRLDEIVALGYPVLAGTSRKSFIGAVLDLPEHQRVEGTAATVAWAIARGASIVRVHDVRELTRVVRMCDAIRIRGEA
ncbi:MAG TPA: dihydropteroate synthase [Actinomycetota bacterium]|nr:dihydropteroate synthase [Actinomycetota bacterium]